MSTTNPGVPAEIYADLIAVAERMVPVAVDKSAMELARPDWHHHLHNAESLLNSDAATAAMRGAINLASVKANLTHGQYSADEIAGIIVGLKAHATATNRVWGTLHCIEACPHNAAMVAAHAAHEANTCPGCLFYRDCTVLRTGKQGRQ